MRASNLSEHTVCRRMCGLWRCVMIWALLALVGVPLWLCALGILALAYRNRSLRKRYGDIAVRVQRTGKIPVDAGPRRMGLRCPCLAREPGRLERGPGARRRRKRLQRHTRGTEEAPSAGRRTRGRDLDNQPRRRAARRCISRAPVGTERAVRLAGYVKRVAPGAAGPVPAGRDTYTTPHPPFPARRPAWRRRKSLMTTDQVRPGADPADASESRRRCPRAGRYAVTSGRRRRAAAPPGRVRER